MSDASQIRINALLLEREALFVRIHEIERAASALLREPYPFTRPPLPSDVRGKRKPAARSPARQEGGFTAKDLRKLEPGETAYRVTYRQFGQTRVETHESVEALRTLLAAQSAQLKVLALETVDADGVVKAALKTGPSE
jgi:hypothetical protein